MQSCDGRTSIKNYKSVELVSDLGIDVLQHSPKLNYILTTLKPSRSLSLQSIRKGRKHFQCRQKFILENTV